MTPPAGTPAKVSIPPHLRYRKAAAVATLMDGATEELSKDTAPAQAQNGSAGSIATATATASTASNVKVTDGARPSPQLGARHLPAALPSPPVTNQGSDKVSGSNGLATSKHLQPAKAVASNLSAHAQSPEIGPTHNAATPTWDTVEYPAQSAATPAWDTVEYPPTAPRNFGRSGWQKGPTKNVVDPKWDTPAPRQSGQSSWKRGSRQPYKKTVWPKNRDMKAPPSDEESDGGVVYKSDSEGDEYYDVKKLMDWNGDWLPPPETWAARKGYSDRHFSETIEKWIVLDEKYTRPMKLEEPAFSGRQSEGGNAAPYTVGKTVAGKHEYLDLVPRYWVDSRVEDKTLGEYWTDQPKKMPEALPDCDIMADVPWWGRFVDHSSCYITSLEVPESRVNMQDDEEPVRPGQLISAEDRLSNIMKHRKARQEKTIAMRNRPLPVSKVAAIPVESRGIQPTANIYVRPVQPADVRGIAEIYNYYVENSIFTSEFDGRTEDMIRRRVDTVTRAGLPYLVAVVKGNQPRHHAGHIAEKIVGFIGLDDYVDQSSMFRYTFDMELFVHPGFLQTRIAMCLLDKLLHLADTDYITRGGYDYENKSRYLSSGPGRVIKTILLNVHHESGKEIEWQSKLLNGFGFKRCGRMPGVGYKHNQVVDVSIFSHQTGEEIFAAGVPMVAS